MGNAASALKACSSLSWEVSSAKMSAIGQACCSIGADPKGCTRWRRARVVVQVYQSELGIQSRTQGQNLHVPQSVRSDARQNLSRTCP